MNPQFCNVREVNETLLHAYQLTSNLEFNPNSYLFLDSIFQILKTEMERNRDFLANVECELTNKLFKNILDRTKKYSNQIINITSFQPNDILLIRSPSIFAPYHFIVAVISQDKQNVNIYQSFGSSIKLNNIKMSYTDFVSYLERIKQIINSNLSFFDYYNQMKPIEEKLYGIDFSSYLQKLENYYKQEDEDEDEDLDDEDIKDKEEATSLGISLLPYISMKADYERIKPDLVITAYRVSSSGGKRKKVTKTYKRKYKKHRNIKKTRHTKKYKKYT